MTSPILLAAGLDWLEGLLPAVFVGFWILSQVFALFRRAARVGGPVVVMNPAPAVEAEPVPNRERLQQEIETFLRERRTGRPSQHPQAQGPTTKPVRRKSTPPHDQRRRQPDGRQPVQPPSTASLPPVPAVTVHSDVARHVEEAFAHDLAHEVPVLQGDTAATRPTPAVGLATLLRDPATIRRLIVMREVLERPTERWS
jgi:hypothetical protein